MGEWGGVISLAIGGIKGSRKLSEHPCHIKTDPQRGMITREILKVNTSTHGTTTNFC